MSPSN